MLSPLSPMRKLSGSIRRAAAALGLAALFAVACARGQSAPAPASATAGDRDPAILFNRAIGSFAAGDYKGAVASINSLLQNLPKDLPPPEKAKLEASLEPIYFTLGAAYFNLQDYPQAITALKGYLAKYPKGARLADATFSLAQSHYFAKDYPEAATTFATLENNKEYREQALLLEAASYKEARDLDHAVAALERLNAGGIKSPAAARGTLQLVRYYAEKKEPEKSLKALADVQANLGQLENVIELNATALAQGDAYVTAGKFKEALICYRAVHLKDEVIAIEKDRIDALQDRLKATQAAIRADPKNAASLLVANRQLVDSVAEDQKLLDNFAKLPSIRSKLLFRLGRAFAGAGETWKSIVAYNDAYELTTDPADREPSLFSLITAYADVNQPRDARAACDAYLREFPKGANVSTVGYLYGATALQENDALAAESYFGRVLAEQQPDSTLRAEITFLLGNAQFSQGKYDEAEASYRQYLSQYQDGTHVEDANYRVALCSLFNGKYEEAARRINDFLKKYPQSEVVPDARYRLAVCANAASDFKQVIAACQDWIKKYPGDQQQGEVLALLGDAYNATEQPDEAFDAYQQSYKIAATDEVLNYSLFAAAKIPQKRNEWDKVDAMFEEFVKDHPDRPQVVQAAYWIARAKAKLGKADEAKQYLAGVARKYIDDPSRDAVEQLLDQLAALCLKKKPAAVAAMAGPAPSAEATPDPGSELDQWLGGAEQDQSPTARARVLYAKAQLARLRRQAPEAERNLLAIAATFKPEVLSPTILGQVGDALLARGKLDEAAPYYQQLLDFYHKSDAVDFAYNGLGEIAFQQKQYARALGFFTDATEKIAAFRKLKDVTVGQAKTLLALGRLPEAKKIFEQAASVREWRGETTAFCIYSVGQIEAQQSHWAEANAYYQRVFVGYQKFLPWVAKAYIGSAESLEKLGKTQDAIKTYQEMVRNEKLTDFPEAAQARQRLLALGAS